ncbi:39S ribosomal protein L23, mitochondrial-like isoform X2 [Centruroides sculpturatus]|nr:39S ribosomal protein L23, mitochondrial-like isoform X2 [Centruroides sculpturatus]
MTSHDVKSYLEKIYKIPVMQVTTRVWSGEIKKNEYFGHLRKEDDYRMAYVVLPREYKFEFPELFPKEKKKEEEKELKDFDKRVNEYKKNIWNENRADLPPWFNI